MIKWWYWVRYIRLRNNNKYISIRICFNNKNIVAFTNHMEFLYKYGSDRAFMYYLLSELCRYFIDYGYHVDKTYVISSGGKEVVLD